MQDLDSVSSKYLQPKTVEIENDLIMNWYPQRVAASVGRVGRLLELGLGHGYTVPHFAGICDDHVVLEGSPRVIEHFRSQNPDCAVTLAEGYFETWVPDAPFDLIVMGFVLEHVDDPVEILKRYRGFLAPGGRIVIAVPNAKSMNRRLGLAMGMIDDIYDLNDTDHILGHKRNFCRDTLRDAVEACDLQITLEEGIYLKPLPLGVLKTLDDMDANLTAMCEVGIEFPDLCVALLVEAKAR